MGDGYEIILTKPRSGYHNHKSYGRADTTRKETNVLPSAAQVERTQCDLSGPTQATFGINSLRQKSKTHREKILFHALSSLLLHRKWTWLGGGFPHRKS